MPPKVDVVVAFDQLLSSRTKFLVRDSTSSQSLRPCSVRHMCGGGFWTSLQMRDVAARMSSRGVASGFLRILEGEGEAVVGALEVVGEEGRGVPLEATKEPEEMLKCRFCA